MQHYRELNSYLLFIFPSDQKNGDEAFSSLHGALQRSGWDKMATELKTCFKTPSGGESKPSIHRAPPAGKKN